MSTDVEKTENAAQSEEEMTEETVETVKTAVEEEKPEEKKKKFGRKDKKQEEKDEAHAQEIAAMNDKYLRLAAEYDNFRRRSQKEKDSLYTEVKADTLTKLLPVYDNLTRALATPTEDEAYRKGVELIMSQFSATMEKLGVEKIESLGQKFDPAVHNAVMHVDDEEKGENEIVEVFQEGFKIGDKVVRFAMVKVAN